ncbi:MAG: MobA/MobL family protein [Lachnospiraceae bacterium]|jgi:hypothetical protein|nr:MobA/MobL family protein [Lachnospiraceae bacterium]
MAIFHCSVKIIGRSKGKSAIAAAAYRAGEKLYDRETGLTHDFTRKGGVVHREILLPDHAPKEYLDRQTLWESVTKVEKKSNAQFAREVEVALPMEFSRELQLAVIWDYVQTNFVSKGMCADIAIHDKSNGNPHAHILLTARPIKADGSWDAKEKKEYARDENGNRIPLIDKKTGKQKLGKRNEKLWKRITVQANDWNDRGNVDKWRKSWADICNRYLSVEQQIDHRSYKRQGLPLEPTIHEGFRARQMEQRGEVSDRCEYNRIIRQLNSVTKEWYQAMKALHQMIMEKVRDFIGRIYERVAGGIGYSGKAGRDSGTGGKPADGNRTASGEQGTFHSPSAKSGTDRISGEIEQRERHAIRTESDIAETDSRIAELKERILEKVRERNERIRRLQQRRADRQSAESNGGYGTGTDRQKQGIENATESVEGEKPEDTESFFRQSETEIADTIHELRTLRARGAAATADREIREIQRQRYHLSGEREIESKDSRNRKTRKRNAGQSRGDSFRSQEKGRER